MVNYSNSKIYKLVCRKTGLVYVGATTKKYLSQRLAQHTMRYRLSLNGSRCAITSSKIIEGGDYYMELIETFPCASNDELSVRERYWIECMECVNKYIPSRTQQEWRDENKEVRSIKMKAYYLNKKLQGIQVI